jgi:diguanylate cyclase (GGDEF)-like protein/PAS domain S-box-containing protein
MNLRKRTILLLSLTLFGSWVVLYLLSSVSLLNSFASLDDRETRQNVERVRETLAARIDNFTAALNDWANWDDAVTFVEQPQPDFIATNIADLTFSNLGLNAVIFLDQSGRVVYSQGFDLQAGVKVPVSSDLLAHLSHAGSLWPLIQQDLNIHGILPLSEGPMLIACQPILNSQAEGPSHGTLLFGQYLDAPTLAQLSQTIHVTFNLQPVGAAPQLPADSEAARALVALGAGSVHIQAVNNNLVAGYTLIDDYMGHPFWLVRVDRLREIYRQGQATLQFFLIQLLVIGVVFSGATLLLLEGTVLARLSRLGARVSQIGAHGDFSNRVTVEGQDEIAHLAETINQTLDHLELSHSLLQTTLESTDAGILTIDTSGRPATTNRQFFALWGLSESFLQTAGTACFEILANQTAQPARTLECLSYWFAHPSEQGADEFCLTNGRTLECDTLPERIGGADGKIVGRIWNCRDITVRKQAQAALDRRMGELITVRDIAMVGSEANSSGALVELSTKIIGTNLYPTETTNIGLIDEATGLLQVFTSHYVRGDIPGCLLQPNQGIAGRTIATGKSQLVADVTQDPAYIEINPDTRSEICVPLKSSRHILGFLNVESTRPAAFGPADEELLSILADQLATALEKVRMSAEVQRLAITDSLTGLHNRHYFFSEAQRELEHARRYRRPLAAVMLDLDYFKRVNDTYGHAQGDLVLKTVAMFCRKSLRETDLLGRYGGEEFVILLVETPLPSAQEVAERLRAGIAGLQFPSLPGEVLTVTASLGVAPFNGTQPTLDKLLDCADQALYQAKHAGRDRVMTWADADPPARGEEKPA